MKSLLIISSIVLLLNSSIHSQAGWYQQNSGFQNNLNHIEYSNQNYIAIGDNGLYLKSGNGGLNWNRQDINVTANLNFSNSNFIVGDGGLILRTTNSGANWIQLQSGTNSNLNSIILAGTRCFIVGDNGVLLKSTNSGNNWSLINLNTTNNLYGIFLLNANGIIIGQNGYIARSTDYSATWRTISSGTNEDLNNLLYISYDSLLVCGNNGELILSTNFGLTWNSLSSGTNANLNFLYKSETYYTPRILWVAGNSGTIKYSTDNGINWFDSESRTTANLRNITGSGIDMYAVGDQGTILNYTLGTGYFDSSFVDANQIKSYILNNGVLHQKFIGNYDGFEWPKNTNKTAVFSSGILIGAKVNDSIHVAANYLDYECFPGYIDFATQIPHGKYDPAFRIFKVSPAFPGGSPIFDSWSIWPVDQGAPWLDMNNNGIYEPPEDRPLMKGDQNTFCRFTDGYPESHTALAGSSQPLKADILLYTYAVENQQCADIHFMEYKIINKKNVTWDSTFIGFFSDIDLGDSYNDKIGCDTSLNMGFYYNASNYDNIYGSQPPAFGFVIYEATGHSRRYMDYFNNPVKNQLEPENKNHTFNLLKGLKRDGTAWINPVNNQPTKFVLSGDPELGTGWIDNSYGSDVRALLISSFNSVIPLDTIKFYIAAIIKRGSNHLNSVTQLKNCINQGVINVNEPVTVIPKSFKLFQNFPNPFNPATSIKYDIPVKTIVNIFVYDMLGRTVSILINNKMTEPGSYVIEWDGQNYASGVYFYKIVSEKYTKVKKMVLLK